MEQPQISFLEINKKPLLLAAVIAIVLTLFGGGRVFALIIYSLLTAICAINFEKSLEKSSSVDSGENNAKQKAFNKFLLDIFILIIVFSIVFSLGVIINNPTKIAVPFFTKPFLAYETSLSFIGSIIFSASFIVILISAFAKLFIKKSDFSKMLIVLSTIYIPVLYIPAYLVFLTLAKFSNDIKTAHLIFLFLSVLVFIISLAASAFSISKTRRIFLGKEQKAKKHKKVSIFKL